MTRWYASQGYQWLLRVSDVLVVTSPGWFAAILFYGCATVPSLDKLPTWEYTFCKSGIGGEYRILMPTDPKELPQLALFSVGGPYDKDHVLCVISGDHAILDLGKGKRS